jgi:4'-phosphopantetheinyl transferase
MPAGGPPLSSSNHEVHVWYADFSVPSGSLHGLLDREEQQRAERFKVNSAREQFVISHGFVRLTLARYLPYPPQALRFRTTANGKPELDMTTDLAFNLSHTEGAAALALTASRRIGVDIERIRENLDPVELAARFFSPSEAAWLRIQPVSAQFPAFFSCWTAKEAYIKALGEGFAAPLQGFSVLPGAGNEKLQLEIDGKPCANWSIRSIDVGPELRCAVAVESPDLQLSVQQWRW